MDQRKVEQSRERSSTSPTPWCSRYQKGSLQVSQLTYYISRVCVCVCVHGGAYSVTVIIVGNGYADSSSNCEQGCLHST